MRRRCFIKSLAILSGSTLLSCKRNKLPKSNNGDITNIRSLVGKEISLEGEIMHVCPINGMKMKLKTIDGTIIKVISSEKKAFDINVWNKKRVKVNGILEEFKLSNKTIAKNYNDKKLLCHIDFTPCIDKEWSESKWENGTAEDYLNRYNDNLNKQMADSGNDYISVFTIVAKKIELV